MLRSFVNLKIGQSIIQKPSAVRLLSTKQQDATAATRKKLETKLKAAKQKLKDTNTKVKAMETKHKQLGKDRQKQEQEQLKGKQLKQKELEKKNKLAQAKLIAKAIANHRPVNLRGFIAMTQKVPITQLSSHIDKLSADELEKYAQARQEYNDTKKSFFSPKPELPPIRAYNVYLGKRYDEFRSSGLDNTQIFKEVASEWKSLSPEEKAQYSIPNGATEKRRELLKEWTDKRLTEYSEFLKWKDTYKFHL